MKLNQFKKYRWADTKFLQDKANHEKEEAMLRQGFSAAEIAEKSLRIASSICVYTNDHITVETL